MKKVWNWTNQTDNPKENGRTLFLNGTTADESWYDDDVTPQLFKNDLYADSGDVTVWLNSPGGDCVAAAQIYNMLKEYPGNVTIKIDGIAASAASLIAMAGDNVLMSPVSMMMIHNPLTMAIGNADDMQKAAAMLDEVKESIINAYELKTGLSRAKLSHLMDDETWMNAVKAVELGFADGSLYRDANEKDEEPEEDECKPDGESSDGEAESESDEEKEKNNNKGHKTENKAFEPMLFSRQKSDVDLIQKINKGFAPHTEKSKEPVKQGRSAAALMEGLNLMKY